MTFTYHSSCPLLTHCLRIDFLMPKGEAVTISMMDVAIELCGIRAVIRVLQVELKGTSMQDPSGGVAPTSTGWLEHDCLDENTRTTNWTGTLLRGVRSAGEAKSSTCSATA